MEKVETSGPASCSLRLSLMVATSRHKSIVARRALLGDIARCQVMLNQGSRALRDRAEAAAAGQPQFNQIPWLELNGWKACHQFAIDMHGADASRRALIEAGRLTKHLVRANACAHRHIGNIGKLDELADTAAPP